MRYQLKPKKVLILEGARNERVYANSYHQSYDTECLGCIHTLWAGGYTFGYRAIVEGHLVGSQLSEGADGGLRPQEKVTCRSLCFTCTVYKRMTRSRNGQQGISLRPQ